MYIFPVQTNKFIFSFEMTKSLPEDQLSKTGLTRRRNAETLEEAIMEWWRHNVLIQEAIHRDAARKLRIIFKIIIVISVSVLMPDDLS